MAQIYQIIKVHFNHTCQKISVYQWRQSLEKAVIYDKKSTNVRLVQELKDVNVGVISKVCWNFFFVQTCANFVFVLACAEIALSFPISCAADISF